jgi:hypothetical protein
VTRLTVVGRVPDLNHAPLLALLEPLGSRIDDYPTSASHPLSNFHLYGPIYEGRTRYVA